jgi:hypothetical protein
MNNDRLIELAIEGLKETRKRVDSELTALLALAGITITTEAPPSNSAKTPGRKKRTAAQTKAHSERMKKIWAERKKAKK